MIRSYLGLSLSLCLMFTGACSSSDGGDAGGGSGGSGSGGSGGQAPSEGVLTKDITLGCSNNLTANLSSLPADLQVDASAITGGEEFLATLAGTVFFPMSFLDVAQTVVPGGLAIAQLIDTKVVVQVRSGATETEGSGGAGGDNGIEGRSLRADVENLDPGLTSLCEFSLGTCSTTTTTQCADDAGCPEGETCTGGGENVKPCDQANDNPDGSNPACLPAVPDGPICQDPIVLVAIPTSDDCAPDGECDVLGKAGAGSQCELNGFCVTGDLAVTLKPDEQTYLADASGGAVLFGWADEGLSNPTLDPDTGIYDLPRTDLSKPLEQGIVVQAGVINIKLECVMAVEIDEENETQAYTPDSALIEYSIK